MAQGDAFYRLNPVDTRLLFGKHLIQKAACGRLRVEDTRSEFETYLNEYKAKPPVTAASLRVQISKFRKFIELGKKNTFRGGKHFRGYV